MAHSLLDDHWATVRRLVEPLCAHPLPVWPSGRLVEKFVGESTLRREVLATRRGD